jgi:hypothetical protein
VIMTAAFLVGVRAGVVGLATSWAVAYPFVFAITTFRALGVLGVRAREFTSAVVPPAVAAALMAGVAALLRSTLPLTVIPLRLALVILAGAAIYAAFLLPLRRHAFADLSVLLRR